MFVREDFALSGAALSCGEPLSWKGIIFGPGTMQDGMGRKSGRNGAPAPQSRVSLSELIPRERLCSTLGVRTEFLAGCSSGFAVDLSAQVYALAQCCLRARREPAKFCAQKFGRRVA